VRVLTRGGASCAHAPNQASFPLKTALSGSQLSKPLISAGQAIAAISNYYSLEGNLSDNTIPYSMFDCLGLSFPVTPVLVGGGTVMSPNPPATPVEPFSREFEAVHKEQ
jgi:hypothetical protein